MKSSDGENYFNKQMTKNDETTVRINQTSGHRRKQRRQLEKTIKERCRRDKINNSIMQLRKMIQESVNLPYQEFSRLEKADILEMTIQQLKSSTNLYEENNYQNGIQLCTNETLKFLQQLTNFHQNVADNTISTTTSSSLVKLIIDRIQKNSIISLNDFHRHATYYSTNYQTINGNFNGVLLDLSQNRHRQSFYLDQNDQHDQIQLSNIAKPTVSNENFTDNMQHQQPPVITIGKREIFAKIRRKIFEKRRLKQILRYKHTSQNNSNDDFMWRPW